MQRPATSLFLDFVSDLSNVKKTETVVQRLLGLGAPLTISENKRSQVFRMLPIDGYRWWLENGSSEPGTRTRHPIALARLLNRAWIARDQWSDTFLQMLGQRVCCTLDADPMCDKSLPGKVPRLTCLAARHLEESELDCLPSGLRLGASKHRRF